MTNEPTSIASNLADKAKLASEIASKQTELAKLQKVTLTSAYIKLGRWAYETKSGKETLPEHFDAVSALNARIRKIQDTEPVPAGDDFKSKAKSIAKAGSDAGQIKLLQAKLQKAQFELGRAVSESPSLNVPPEFSERIRSTKERGRELEAEVEELSTQINASGMNIRWIYVCLIPAFGIGLFLIWISSVWSKSAKIGWTVATATTFVFAILMMRGGDESDISLASRNYGSVEEGYERWQGDVGDSFDSGRDSIDDTYESGRASVDEAFERGRGSVSDSFKSGRGSIDDAFNRGRGSVSDAYDRGRGNVSDAYDDGGGSAGDERTYTEAEQEALYEKLVFKVKVGSTASEVTSLLGEPSSKKQHVFPHKSFSMWTWKLDEDSSISLVIENGVVTMGGTPGFDIRTGFKSAP